MQRVWECQAKAAATVPHVYLGASNDLWDAAGTQRDRLKTDEGVNNMPGTGWPTGGTSNPHPPNKHLVAQRLADIALVETDDGKAPNWFELSDGTRQQDRDMAPLVYTKAEAKIVGPDSIEVRSTDVKTPKHVRFAWHPLARHNVYNSAAVPAINFRTDVQPTKRR